MIAYTEFVTTQANLLADLRTAILASTDWTRPNAAGKPSLYKATTTRGADMIIDLEDAALTMSAVNAAIYKTHDGTTGTGRGSRYIYFRQTTSGASAAMPIYATVSAGKEHLFIMLEGPRGADTGASNTSYGSQRNYLFFSDLVPYHAADATPVVICGGQSVPSSSSSAGNNSHQAYVSAAASGTPWGQGKLVTLDFPSMFTTDTIQTQRICAWDGNYYLAPYVFFGDEDGIRGRLSSFFFAGYNQTTDSTEVAGPPLGAKVQYDGNWYKLLPVNKGDNVTSSPSVWGVFGAAANSNNSGVAGRSIVVAVPCTA